MAFDQTKRIPSEIVAANRKALVAIQTLPDYSPTSRTCTATVLTELGTAMEQAQQAEIRARNAFNSARNAARAAEWALHNALLEAKLQVMVQYGVDSDAIKSLGLKKKSERKRPTRRKPVETE